MKGHFMDVEKLEKLAELRDKGALTQEEFETEKKKLLNSEANIQDIIIEETTLNNDENLGDKTSDFWHDHGIKILMMTIIVIGVGYM